MEFPYMYQTNEAQQIWDMETSEFPPLLAALLLIADRIGQLTDAVERQALR